MATPISWDNITMNELSTELTSKISATIMNSWSNTFYKDAHLELMGMFFKMSDKLYYTTTKERIIISINEDLAHGVVIDRATLDIIGAKAAYERYAAKVSDLIDLLEL